MLIPPLLILSAASVLAGPCDIYASGNTPCVAAHGTTRALYDKYSGPLYSVQRASDGKTIDISPISPGQAGNGAAQDSFCFRTTCEIVTIYDQSGNNNHLTRAPKGTAGAGPEPGGSDYLAGAKGAPVTLNGRKAYGVFVSQATGYRNDATTGVAKDTPGMQGTEGIYAVLDGTHYNGECCFDYGNAEVANNDPGNGHMETIYFGNRPNHGTGAGPGPWLKADLENGLYIGGPDGSNNLNSPTITSRFFTGIVKGNSSNLWALRGGDSTSGGLSTFYSGQRPGPSYYPMQREGAVVLGVGGDNSRGGIGTFYEGAMLSGYPSNETEDAVQANIVSAGYAVTSLNSGLPLVEGTTVTLQSRNMPGKYLGHTNGTSPVSLMSASILSSASTKNAVSFKVRSGLGNSGCFSFESVDQSGQYLRQNNYGIYLQPPSTSVSPNTFNLDATFCTETGLSGIGTTSFRHWGYPTRYLRNVDSNVYIGMNGGPTPTVDGAFVNDQASWIVALAVLIGVV